MNTITQPPCPMMITARSRPGAASFSLVRGLSHGATLLAFVALAVSVQAQPAYQIRSQPVRITVPTGVSGVRTNMIYVSNTNSVTALTLSVSSTPAGVSAVLGTPDPNPLLNVQYPNEGKVPLVVTYDANVPQVGVTNEIVVQATGPYNYRLPIPINSGITWGGNTNNNAFATSGNWLGGVLPTSSDLAVFPSAGASPVYDTNNAAGNDNYFPYVVTNVVISADETVGALRFSHGDVPAPGSGPDPDSVYRVEIKSNATLAVTGDRGFSFLQDTLNTAGSMQVQMFGGGTLLVSNANANFALLKENNQNVAPNLQGLDNFIVDVDRIGLGDYRLYPYYATNGYSATGGAGTNSRVSRFTQYPVFARTNILRATHVDPGVLTNKEVRDYSMTFGNNNGQGSTTDQLFLLGISNVFLMDSIVFCQAGAQAEVDQRGGIRFNTDTNFIPTNVVPVAYFRNTDGGRMSVFTVCDNAGIGGIGSGSKGDLILTRGRVDALVDLLYIGRDRLESEDNDRAEGVLSIADGLFDVNTVIIGAQELGSNAIPADEEGNDPSGEAVGTLNVSTSAVFVVHDTMHLGWTTAPQGDKRNAQNGGGTLNITDGGTVMANNILVGGIGTNAFGFAATRLSQNNVINILDGGELIVTNGIADTDKPLTTLTLRNSTLALNNVDASSSTPYVYADTVTGDGVVNYLKLISVSNLVTVPTQLPLIAYTTASGKFKLDLPAGLYGFVVNNTNKTIDAVITTNEPANLVWDGTPGTIWDTNAANWQGGAVFVDGDNVRFDDSLGGSSSVTVSSKIYPSEVLVSNTPPISYTLGGGGTISGLGSMEKWGTGSLAVDTTSELALTIYEGTVTGTGAIGATEVTTNGTLNFSGTIAQLNSSGSAVNSGTIVLGVDLNGGTFTNTGAVNRRVNVNAGEMYNDGAVTISNLSCSVGADGHLNLKGTWVNNGTQSRVDIAGTLIGTGSVIGVPRDTGVEPPSGSVNRLSISSGGEFSPGATPGSIVIFTNGTRFDFVQGSRLIIDTDPGSMNSLTATNYASDTILADRWSTMLGTIEMTNVGVTPYAVGQSFRVFLESYWNYGYANIPLNSNQIPVMDPPSPGLGLLWDLDDFRTNGIISIKGTASTPTELLSTVTGGTNVTFSWPSAWLGWELQTQTRSLTNGISLDPTNWTVVGGSTTVTNLTITNWINTNSGAVFYRLAHPRYQ